MKKLWSEFKEFINRGNVMDLAVAVVMGAAFTAIINSVVNDLISPLISLLTFNTNFSDLYFTIGDGANPPKFAYGNLLQAIINFVITALVIFLIIKAANTVAKKNILDKAPPTMSCPYCSTSIPDTAIRCPNCTTILKPSKVPEDVR